MEIWQIITTNNNCKFLKEIKHFSNDDTQRICHYKDNIYADCIKEKCPLKLMIKTDIKMVKQ